MISAASSSLPKRDARGKRSRRRNARQPAQTGGAARRVSDPREWRAVGLFAHASNQCGRIVQDPILERPGTASRFARAFAMMPEIGEPYVQASGTEEMSHPPHPLPPL